MPGATLSTHHRVSRAGAALRRRTLLIGGDNFKLRGGALCRREVSGCTGEKPPARGGGKAYSRELHKEGGARQEPSSSGQPTLQGQLSR